MYLCTLDMNVSDVAVSDSYYSSMNSTSLPPAQSDECLQTQSWAGKVSVLEVQNMSQLLQAPSTPASLNNQVRVQSAGSDQLACAASHAAMTRASLPCFAFRCHGWGN